MRNSIFSIGIFTAALAGCSAAPKAVESDAQSYLPALSTYVSGVWEVKNTLSDLLFFFCQSSNDEYEESFNPGGYHPVRGLAPESLQLIIFPGHAYQERFENWEPPHGVGNGYLLARVVVNGALRDFIRPYVLTGYDNGKAKLEIGGLEYTLLVGPKAAEMKLIHTGALSPEEPSLELRRVNTLPGRDGFLFGLNGLPVTYDREKLPPGVQAAN